MEQKHKFFLWILVGILAAVITASQVSATCTIYGCVVDKKNNSVGYGTNVGLYINGNLRATVATGVGVTDATRQFAGCNSTNNTYFLISLQDANGNCNLGSNISANSTYNSTSGRNYGKNSTILAVQDGIFPLNISINKPVVTLVSPLPNETIFKNFVSFNYTVSKVVDIFNVQYNIVNCSLILNEVINQTNIGQNFNLSNLHSGNYTWRVNCTDDHGFWELSEPRNFTVDPCVNANYTLNFTNGTGQFNSWWYSMSIPVCINETNISELLSGINGQYDRVERLKVGPNKQYESYLPPPFPFPSEFTTMVILMEYQIHFNVSNPNNITFKGNACLNNETVNLQPGWNSFGWVCLETRNITDVLSGISGNYDRVEHLKSGPNKQYESYLPPPFPFPSEFTTFESGKGYQIHVNATQNLTLTYQC